MTHGVGPGDRVAVALQPSAAWVTLALALAKLGATPAVLPPDGDPATRALAAGALMLDPDDLPALAAPHAVARSDAVGDGESLGQGTSLLVERAAGQDVGAVDDGGFGRPAIGQPLEGPGRGKRSGGRAQRLGGSPDGVFVPVGFCTGVTFGYWNWC